MTLKERYNEEDNVTLISILENSDNYTSECISVVQEILNNRDFDPHFQKNVAESLMRDKIKKMLDTFDPINEKIKLPESNFLNDEEIIEILKEEFEKFIETKEALKFDVWKYAIGGIL